MIMNTQNKASIITALIICLAGCSEDKMYTPDDNQLSSSVRITASIEQLNSTRANDSGFSNGDRIGIYMVDFENGVPASVKGKGNHADNISFTFNEPASRWDSSTSLYFTDNVTPADFYGYYPYIETIDDVSAIPFCVERNQSRAATSEMLSGYEKSDLLWAKTDAASPSTSSINLTFNHILSGLKITLVEGDGFDEGEWETKDKDVLIDGTIKEGTLDLGKGAVILSSSTVGDPILANPTEDGFRGIVIPQSVAAGKNLITINVGSDSYTFKKNVEMQYIPGKLHKFTFEVSKKLPEGTYKFDLIDESVTVWENDPISHSGLNKAYQVVEIKHGERINDVLTSININPADVVNLKITGEMIGDDFLYIRDNMRKIQALNLKELRITDDWMGDDDCIPEMALTNSVTLKYLVLPDHLLKIGEFAFAGTILEGSLKIPDGVVSIGAHAFTNYWNENNGYSRIPGGQLLANNNFTGSLELPSTVEYIGTEAFRECDFTGTLILPKSLKYLGRNAFHGCSHFTGEIHFPESLTEIEATDWISPYENEGVFCGMPKLAGNFELPKNLKVINGFGGIDVSSILFSEEAIEIGAFAFRGAKVKGGVVIPDNIISIGKDAFYGCTANYIKLPQNITRISGNCFWGCRNWADTLKIPNKVEVIEEYAFANCSKLSAVELPASLTHIGQQAFDGCYSLEYIHCNAIEPPIISESTFWGVEKDNFTVEVPEGSVDAYRNAQGWSEFKRISAYRNFVARPSKYNVLNKGGKKEIVLNADGDWELTKSPAWCHIDKQSGSKKTSLTLTVDALSKGMPFRTGDIIFRLKGAENHTTKINVVQYDYEYDEDQCITLQNATKGKGIDLMLLGDGYDAKDISTGTYLKDMKQTMEYFFAVEPYSSYKEYFNVYTSIALSEDSGIEDLFSWRTTKFHTILPFTCGLRITADYKGAMNYCQEVCAPIKSKPDPKLGLILLANHTAYDGVTYMMDESFCSLVTKSESSYPLDARGLVQHEAGGHGFGWLADEYIYHNDFIQKCNCNCCEHEDQLMAQQNRGFGLNLSLNGKYKEVPWTHLIFNPSYGNLVDIYEGGYFHRRGVFRSEYNSCMNNNIAYFSTWSRQLIVQRIMMLAGEQFTIEDFYANDKKETGRDFTVSRSGTSHPNNSVTGTPPVFVKDYKFGKKGGCR